jgi:hypothetical protein
MAVVHELPMPAAAHPVSALVLVRLARSPCNEASIATAAIPCAASRPAMASTSPFVLVSPWAKTTVLKGGAVFGTVASIGSVRLHTSAGLIGSDHGPGGVMLSGLQSSRV